MFYNLTHMWDAQKQSNVTDKTKTGIITGHPINRWIDCGILGNICDDLFLRVEIIHLIMYVDFNVTSISYIILMLISYLTCLPYGSCNSIFVVLFS